MEGSWEMRFGEKRVAQSIKSVNCNSVRRAAGGDSCCDCQREHPDAWSSESVIQHNETSQCTEFKCAMHTQKCFPNFTRKLFMTRQSHCFAVCFLLSLLFGSFNLQS